MKHTNSAIILVGPTAVGKTELSLSIAKKYSGQIISVDSQQVYRYMDIGTAKPTHKERAGITHHLIDVADPDEDYNVARFIKDAVKSIAVIREQGDIPILAGGTGLYFKGLLEGLFDVDPINPKIRENLKKELEGEGRQNLYKELCRCDPGSAARIHPNDTQRLIRALEIFRSSGMTWSDHLASRKTKPILTNALKLGLTYERERLYKRINTRVGHMVDSGLVDEVKKLLEMGYHGGLNSMQSIGYRHMVNFLKGVREWEESLELLAGDTRRYAKRQYTWFRRDTEITWFDPARKDEIFSLIDNFLIHSHCNDE
ncbi:MAG: tRNA (adenosine(37)-N6)-dimethylallyltransferase MiaA [Thermodesulfobacteriota bacterium]|nr:tRNA (adenosine(37)-N6)-dimethylallyltransferase MiaA [Thermodesulfobacteriota bacterium]